MVSAVFVKMVECFLSFSYQYIVFADCREAERE